MSTYKHSVYLDIEKCNGCTSCLRHCPTEAIRIKNCHAVIDEERCIDCGECIRVCPNSAKKAVGNSLSDMDKFKFKIALPAPTLYGQFDNMDNVNYILNGLLKLGFDDVFEVSAAAELVSGYTRTYLNNRKEKTTIISSACPVILRLIGLRFPSLQGNIIPMLPPMEVAADLARKKALKENPHLKAEDIGVCFISPCPAKISYVRNGFADYKSKVDVVVTIKNVYFELISKMKYGEKIADLSASGKVGVGWASSGGESAAISSDSFMAADGIDNCIKILDQIENGNMPQLEFIELNACIGGCVGGVSTIQNPFIAKARLQSLRRNLPPHKKASFESGLQGEIPEDVFFNEFPVYKPISRLSDSMQESMQMMMAIEKLKEELPGIDCGSCGAPTCRAFAEDIVKNQTTIDNCLIRGRTQKECEPNDS